MSASSYCLDIGVTKPRCFCKGCLCWLGNNYPLAGREVSGLFAGFEFWLNVAPTQWNDEI